MLFQKVLLPQWSSWCSWAVYWYLRFSGYNVNQEQYIAWMWNEWLQYRNPHVRESLIEHYSYLAYEIADQLASRLPRHSYDALAQFCLDALPRTINAFNPKKGESFEIFCCRYIRILKSITLLLTRFEKMIIYLHYYHEKSFEEIGRILNLPETRISKMHSSTIMRLRSWSR